VWFLWFSAFAIRVRFPFLLNFSGSNRNVDTGSSYSGFRSREKQYARIFSKKPAGIAGENHLYFDKEVGSQGQTFILRKKWCRVDRAEAAVWLFQHPVENREEKGFFSQIQVAITDGKLSAGDFYLLGSYSKVIHQIPPALSSCHLIPELDGTMSPNPPFEKSASPGEYIGDYQIYSYVEKIFLRLRSHQ
jgi:hypothetical protein